MNAELDAEDANTIELAERVNDICGNETLEDVIAACGMTIVRAIIQMPKQCWDETLEAVFKALTDDLNTRGRSDDKNEPDGAARQHPKAN